MKNRGGKSVRLSCKSWLWLTVGAVAVLAALVLILVLASSQAQRPKGTSSPPAGPHKAGDVWVADLGGQTTMEMVWCPPGKSLMGSPASEPDRLSDETQHEVTLTQGFWLGKTEVTQKQWSAVMRTTPAYFPRKEIVRWKVWKWQIPVWRKDFLAGSWQLPVEQVSWDDCQEFCKKTGLGFSLPTEAEWEYACRAGAPGPFAGTGVLNEMGWYDGNSGGKTHPAGRKKPNAWGLCDMHGNVWEWCQDWYGGDYPAGAATDPTGPAAGGFRAIRGGGWNFPSRYCRSASRGRYGPGGRNLILGFRVVLPAVRP
jgi:formylglycine-generating enzyme required for sulfatase activity